MVQLDISLIPESMRKGVQPIVDVVDDHTTQLEALQRNRVATTRTLDVLRKDQLAFQRYQPMLDQLAALNLADVVTSLEDAITKFSDSPQFERIMTEILAVALEAPVAEVGKMFVEVQDKIGAVKLDQDALTARVDLLVGRVDKHDDVLKTHTNQIKGLQAGHDDLHNRVVTIEKNGGSNDENSRVLVMGVTFLISTIVLFAGGRLFGGVFDIDVTAVTLFAISAIISLGVALIVSSIGDGKKAVTKPASTVILVSSSEAAPPSPASTVTNSTQPARTPAAAGTSS